MDNTGNIFTDLYGLSKRIDFVRPKADKTKVEIEFEQQRGECTFKPNRNLSKRSFKKVKSAPKIQTQVARIKRPMTAKSANVATIDANFKAAASRVVCDTPAATDRIGEGL
jgi:hypothetical protein